MAISTQDDKEARRKVYNAVPLQASSDIRVLDLLPGLWGFKLRGKLHKISLSDPSPTLKYEALSYVWGDFTAGRGIYIDGQRIKITDNLSNALRRLRHPQRIRTLWVDALCINQNDEAEKGRQIAIMGVIYWTAKSVNIWLGEREQIKLSKSHAKFDEDRQWHRRAWVIQEYVLAQKVYFCAGRLRKREFMVSTYRDPTLFEDLFPSLGFPKDTVPGISTKIHQLAQRRRQSHSKREDQGRGGIDHYERYQKQYGLSILRCFQLVRGSVAQDPRDLVYCLLPLMQPDTARRIGNDYSRPFGEVYTVATFELLTDPNHDLSIDVLGQISPANRTRMNCNLPTWAIDFRTIPEGSQTVGEDFWAHEAALERCHLRPKLVGNGKHLELVGVIVGTIGERFAPESWSQGKPNFSIDSRLPIRRHASGETDIPSKYGLAWPEYIIPSYCDYTRNLSVEGVRLCIVDSEWRCLAPATARTGDVLFFAQDGTREGWTGVRCSVYLVLRPVKDHFLFRGLATGYADPVYRGANSETRTVVVH